VTAILGRPSRSELAPTPRPPTAPEKGFRPEIQALRALAVGLVVIYHLTPLRVPGGYVGVDVFFVVSGFLITGHLLREVDRTGRIRLAQFWARRARRLLPAALLVLMASAVATLLFVPATLWHQFLREIGGSAIYMENWLLAGDAVDYLAAANIASPAQHYWSLSTEEQFYLVWPLLILGAVWLATRVGRRRRVFVAATLAVVTAGSFAYSLWATTHSAPMAYFSTPARAWEFGAGALLAVLATAAPAGRDGLRCIASWAGFAAIAVAAMRFDHATAFPGTAALLPVLGTVAVIWAGAPGGDWSPTKIADFGPVRFLGDISYSAYLWHWPPIVLLPFALGHPLGTRSKIAILLLTIGAAWLTKVLVEDPVRTSTFFSRRGPAVTYLATLVATGAVVATAVLGVLHVDSSVEKAQSMSAQLAGTACFGAAAMAPGGQCADPFGPAETANPIFAKSDLSKGMFCLTNGTSTEVEPCHHETPGATERAALIGDSHAASWWEAVTGAAETRGMSADLYVHSGCPALATDSFIGPRMSPDEPVACRTWSSAVIDTLVADPSVTTVFTSYRSDVYKYRAADGSLRNEWPATVVRSALQPLVDAGKQVYVLRAVPSSNGLSPDGELGNREIPQPDCIATADVEVDPCAAPRSLRVTPDSIADGVAGLPGTGVIDLTDLFCDADLCHTVIGGVIVYWDGSHISATFSRSLAPFLGQEWAEQQENIQGL
jgi:peptidoglycan/LPS O-acetylase OafA/YrhL